MPSYDDRLKDCLARARVLEDDLLNLGGDSPKRADLVFQASFRVGEAKTLLRDVLEDRPPLPF